MVNPVDPSMVSTAPDLAPVAKILDSSGTLVETVKLPLMDRSANLFGKRHLLSSSYTAGRYFVIYQWTLSTMVYQNADVFDVIAGGDVDGQVIGMDYMSLPTGRHLIYETESGKLISGRNPKV